MCCGGEEKCIAPKRKKNKNIFSPWTENEKFKKDTNKCSHKQMFYTSPHSSPFLSTNNIIQQNPYSKTTENFVTKNATYYVT